MYYDNIAQVWLRLGTSAQVSNVAHGYLYFENFVINVSNFRYQNDTLFFQAFAGFVASCLLQ